MMGFVFSGIFVALPTDKTVVTDLHPLYTFCLLAINFKKNPL